MFSGFFCCAPQTQIQPPLPPFFLVQHDLRQEASAVARRVVGTFVKPVLYFVDERADTGPAQPSQHLRIGELGTLRHRSMSLQCVLDRRG